MSAMSDKQTLPDLKYFIFIRKDTIPNPAKLVD